MGELKEIVLSHSFKYEIENLYHDFLNSPSDAIKLIKELKAFPSAVRDGIFFECLETYIFRTNNYDYNQDIFVENNLEKLSIALAESSSNQESDYKGEPYRLHEYAKRILKLIDDCGTIQKSEYLANITRAFINGYLNKKEFFKLGQCIRTLTEEDLLFLQENIKEGIVTDDEDYIDDFRGVGLMYEVEGGFAYSKRAFKLLKFALDFEGTVEIPEKFPEREIFQQITDEEIDALFNGK